MTHSARPNLTKSPLYATVLAMAAMPLFGVPAMGQYTPGTGPTTTLVSSQSSAAPIGVNGSVPSGPASSEVLHLSFLLAKNEPGAGGQVSMH